MCLIHTYALLSFCAGMYIVDKNMTSSHSTDCKIAGLGII